MAFGNADILVLLGIVPVLFLLFLLWMRRKKIVMAQMGDYALIRAMAGRVSTRRQVIRWVLFSGTLTFLIIAAARPQYGFRMETIARQGRDIVIAIDTSGSMLAEDIKPNRLEKAKHEARALLQHFRGDRAGIIAFAGKAHVQCPLTFDYNAVSLFIDSLDTFTIPLPGTNISAALTTAMGVFKGNHTTSRVVILITDGEDHDANALDTAKRVAGEGITVYTIGVGDTIGEPVPDLNSSGERIGYKKQNGSVVTSRLHEDILKDVALAAHGTYYRATPAEFEVDRIYDEISGMESDKLASRALRWQAERFQYPLFLAIVLFIAAVTLPETARTEDSA